MKALSSRWKSGLREDPPRFTANRCQASQSRRKSFMSGILDGIVIGSYIPGDTILHRLDPRTKIVGFLLIVGGVFAAGSPAGVVASLLMVLVPAGLSGAGLRTWSSGFHRFVWMLAIIALVNLAFNTYGAPLTVTGRQLPITTDGLRSSIFFTAQVAEVIVLSMVLTFTTTPQEVARGCARLAQPLKMLRVPVEEIGLVLLLAMRFVPLLQLELRTSVEAQAARGVEFDRGSLVSRARNLIAVLVPELEGALRRADILATAMIARGYRPDRPRSEYNPLRLSGRDYAALSLVVAFFLFQALLFR
jgi:energy-coupling factor transport system permease protein